MLLHKLPAIRVGLIGCLLISLSACANSANQEALERSLAADPKLKENPITLGTPAPNNPQNDKLAGFPAEIPIYLDAQVQEVRPATPDSGQGQTARFTTDAPSNSVLSFYQQQFQSNNWDLVSESETDGTENTLVARQNNLQVTVSVQSVSGTSNPTPTPTQSAVGNNSDIATEFTISYSRDSSVATTPQGSNLKDIFTQPASENPAPSTSSSVFTDINQAPQELRQYVEDLAALGVLTQESVGSKNNSTASGQFEPNKTITRRQFARWLVAVNNQIYANNPGKQIRLASGSAQPAFQDIPRNNPDFSAIQGLAESGLIPSRLTGDATAVLFRPDAPLTRENLILWKVPLDTRSSLPTASVDAVKQTWGFQDAGKTEPKALRAVLADFQNGDLANIRRVFGYTTLFQPKKPVTRAEAAAALWYFGAEGEGISAQDALQNQRQQSQPSPTPSSSPNQQ
ncbi:MULTISPECIES: S-layer homology domain-containing protein [Cyanophyceae]|uniref:S-layer homology domain-containing protein n=1 Tax=Cyanophyceae TaxID=3028117 RepID=UPI001682079C|nr:S-layer homology domain-containing protein [Trichocoleus sp. FACHB-69]MBD1930651.1 S-layer homology domain-containing protein [Trichocoleus sp. FACHB-69]